MTTFVWPYGGSNVALAGTFNSWKQQPMKKTNKGHELTVNLTPGKHEFKYVVDGHWCYDLAAKSKEDKEKNFNNFIDIASKEEAPSKKPAPKEAAKKTSPKRSTEKTS